MLLNGKRVAITPDELYSYIGVRPKFTYIPDLKNAAWGAGQLNLTYKAYANRQQALHELRQNIDAGHAFIALAKYEPWIKLTGNQFKFGHFLLVTGYDDDHVFVHDPLFGLWAQRSRGEFFRFTNKQFLDGWGGFDYTENQNFGCLIPDYSYPFVAAAQQNLNQSLTQSQRKQKKRHKTPSTLLRWMGNCADAFYRWRPMKVWLNRT